MKYVYPAIFTLENSNDYSVSFPDIKGCYTCGDTLDDALFMAEDALSLMLSDYEAKNEKMPCPSNINSIKTKQNEFVNLVCADTSEYSTIEKRVTIPKWLNDVAEKQKVDFSKTLQNGLLAATS